MENEERHASYAAVAGSKSTTNQTPADSVLDSWEEAAQDGILSEELEKSIEQKLDKMKQKQNTMKSAASAPSNHTKGGGASDDGLCSSSNAGESCSSAGELANTAPVIRILKRPQSSGHLPQQPTNQQMATVVNQHSRPTAAWPSASSSDAKCATRNGNAGRNSQQQRTLEERAAAYAEARMRIFGVADQQIHDDLPVQPKLSTTPRSNQSSPGSNLNR